MAESIRPTSTVTTPARHTLQVHAGSRRHPGLGTLILNGLACPPFPGIFSMVVTDTMPYYRRVANSYMIHLPTILVGARESLGHVRRHCQATTPSLNQLRGCPGTETVCEWAHIACGPLWFGRWSWLLIAQRGYHGDDWWAMMMILRGGCRASRGYWAAASKLKSSLCIGEYFCNDFHLLTAF